MFLNSAPNFYSSVLVIPSGPCFVVVYLNSSWGLTDKVENFVICRTEHTLRQVFQQKKHCSIESFYTVVILAVCRRCIVA